MLGRRVWGGERGRTFYGGVWLVRLHAHARSSPHTPAHACTCPGPCPLLPTW